MTETSNLFLENNKLYSANSIGLATFLGGPLAAGYMISENFKVAQQPSAARKAMIIGIAATILIFGSPFLLLEDLLNKVPKQIIPIIYTAIIMAIVKWQQGDLLNAHKENKQTFFSGWRAAGIGFISLIIMSVFIVAYVFLSPENKVYTEYEEAFIPFLKNEEKTLSFYDKMNYKSEYTLTYELEKEVIPKWEENIEIVKRSNQIENLPNDLIERNSMLIEYCQLRIQSFELLKKAIKENTNIYDDELNDIHDAIEAQLKKLN